MIEDIGRQPELYKNNENENMCSNGKRVWVSWTNRGIYEKNGNISGILCIGNDITERKRAEKELGETKDYLDNIIESSLDCIVVSDNGGHITKANKSFLNLLGCKEGEIIGKMMPEFHPTKVGTFESTTGELVEIDKAFLDETSEIVSRFLRDGEKHNWETFLVLKNKKVIPVDINIVILYDDGRNRIGSVGVLRDITERKKAEKKLLEYQNRLKSLASQLTLTEEKDRRRFATYLHDQVGQALFISKLKLGTIKEQASSTDMAESLEEIINIIEQTIKETRSLTFELSPPILYQLGLEAALEWLVEQMQEQYGMTIYFEDDKRSKPLDESVLILLFRAVRELLINVTRHAKAQNVKVNTRRDGENIKIFVEDDGVGFTVSKNGSSNHKNDGFGLFSIEERLDSLGGYLEIESEVGRGACVTIIAPLNRKKGN